MGAQAVGQLAAQVKQGPGDDHDQQLRQERLLCAEELGQEGGKEQDVLGIARPQYKGAPEQCTKARHGCRLGHFSGVGRLPGLLPALPGEVEQIQGADDFQGAEQLLRGQQQRAKAQGRGAQQADRGEHPAEKRRVRAAQTIVQAVADHQ